MNFLGKILVVLIFIMSICFMVFSFMVFMTQTSWKDMAEKRQSELRRVESENTTKQAEITRLMTLRASENAARTNAIALLEARLASSSQQMIEMNRQLAGLQAQQAQQGEQVTGSIQTLQTERQKVDTLRSTVKTAQSERDQMFSEVVDLKNKVLELEAIRQRLAQRDLNLRDQVSRQRAVLRANDLDENDDISTLPPTRDGEIRQVDAKNKYVVLSLGSDDGMKRGHKVEVHRGEKYLGRVQINKTHPDRSVGEILDDFRQGAVRSGDRVRTR